MNQDLGFVLTPAKARKLMKVSEICSTEIDPIIAEAAKIDLVNVEGPERPLAQFIADMDFRCGICCTKTHDFKREDILLMLSLIGVEKLIVTGQNLMWWSFLENWQSTMTVTRASVPEIMDHEFQKGIRDSVVLYDFGHEENQDTIQVIGLEFPKMIVYASSMCTGYATNNTFLSMTASARGITLDNSLVVHDYKKNKLKEIEVRKRTTLVSDNTFPWWQIGCALLPNMPRAIFDISAQVFSMRVTHKPVWKKSDVNDLAFMYNVFLPAKMEKYGIY